MREDRCLSISYQRYGKDNVSHWVIEPKEIALKIKQMHLEAAEE